MFKEHPYLKPIFRTRSSFLLYDLLSKVSQTLIEVQEMKIKQVSILGMCGTKLTKALLKHLVNEPIDFGKVGAGPDCRRALLDSLQLLLSPFKF